MRSCEELCLHFGLRTANSFEPQPGMLAAIAKASAAAEKAKAKAADAASNASARLSDSGIMDKVDKTLDALAQHLETHFAIDQLLGLAEPVKVDA